jgi:uncharacterized membrane protein
VLDAAAVRQLRDTGFVVLDGVLSSAQLHAAREDCAALGMRFADTDQHHKSVRSDQVFWVSEDEGSIWEGRETCEGLLVALRVLRAMPSALLRHGSSGSGRWLGFGSSEGNDLGVPRKGQVARYVAAGNSCMSSAEDSVANNGDSVEAAAASATVVSATGGARYTAHRDGIPSLGSASALLLMSNPSVCMRECTAIIYLSPLLVTALSVPLLGERISRLQWLGVAVGFIGVLFIARPGGALFHPVALLALGAAFSFSLYQIITRKLNHTDKSSTTNFISGLVCVIITSVLLPFFWKMPSAYFFGLMILLGISALVSHLLMTKAYQHAKPSTLAPFSYLQLLFAGFIGYAFFDQVPDFFGLIGMLVIVTGGLLVMGKVRK